MKDDELDSENVAVSVEVITSVKEADTLAVSVLCAVAVVMSVTDCD